MDYKMLKETAGQITMPPKAKQRVTRKVRQLQAKENPVEHKNRSNLFFTKPAVAFAVLAICLSLSITAMAHTGIQQGFFRDIKNWCGAIVGTSYGQADDEISVSATVNGDTLTALAVFSVPQKFPYREAEKLGIAAYRIVDAAGNVIKEGIGPGSSPIANGQAAINIPLDGMEGGSYTLIVSAFVTEKKADQPLTINGTWACDFTK